MLTILCLPFVLIKGTDGQIESVDLRQHRLARLSKAYGRLALKLMEKLRKSL